MSGAYGIFYDTIEANEYQASTNFYPLSSNITTNTIPLTYPPTYNTDSLPTASVAGPITSYATDPSSSLGFLQIQPVKTYSPYFQSWNFGIQREAGKNTDRQRRLQRQQGDPSLLPLQSQRSDAMYRGKWLYGHVHFSGDRSCQAAHSLPELGYAGLRRVRRLLQLQRDGHKARASFKGPDDSGGIHLVQGPGC